jgi:hypothetical protein
MKRSTALVLLAGLMVFAMIPVAFGSNDEISDLAGRFSALQNAELVYQKGPMTIYKAPLGYAPIVAADQPPTVVANAEVYGMKKGEPLSFCLVDTEMRPVFFAYYLLSVDAKLTVKIQVTGPEKFNENYTTEDRIQGGYYYYTLLHTKKEPHKTSGTYTCTITITAKGKQNDPKLSTETTRYFVQTPAE